MEIATPGIWQRQHGTQGLSLWTEQKHPFPQKLNRIPLSYLKILIALLTSDYNFDVSNEAARRMYDAFISRMIEIGAFECGDAISARVISVSVEFNSI